ncbi:Hypothetical predicted protein, partial [Olea europaea subsp. europaea]
AEWIDRLLAKRFFGQCATHCSKKNYLNKYCIDCDSSYCKSRVASGSHNERHKILTIYRHVYNMSSLSNKWRIILIVQTF